MSITAAEASAPNSNPARFLSLSTAASLMNMMTSERLCAPAWKPKEAPLLL